MHRDAFSEAYNLLEDELSKKIFLAAIEARKTLDVKQLCRLKTRPQYFVKEIMPPNEKYEGFIDCGAYVGENTLEFLKKYCVTNSYNCFLWEADKKNLDIIKKNIRKLDKCKVIPYALWSKHTKLTFSDGNNSSSRIEEGGRYLVETETIDDIHNKDTITFIKMDIEGAEIEALKGSRNLIIQQHPKLAISIYHNWEDLYRIPIMIHEMVPEYKLYIRHHTDVIEDTVLYATVD